MRQVEGVIINNKTKTTWEKSTQWLSDTTASQQRAFEMKMLK